MLVTLIGKNSINKIVLPKVIEGSHIVYDKTQLPYKQIVSIQAIDGQWEIIDNRQYCVVSRNHIAFHTESIEIFEDKKNEKSILKNYATYCIHKKETDEVYFLYCSPSTVSLKSNLASSRILINAL